MVGNGLIGNGFKIWLFNSNARREKDWHQKSLFMHLYVAGEREKPS